ncbi:hypothetical protein Clacol_004807 [Clathrus columnatus]|uniref:Uncharacterized protein n=1 Tax=Clathrus columnatus TaxID=1419009 RepID=A0AAV5ACD3_9AGAM|nr:hypothetical protein Clacol_004807 [Clathrus columnatus]
MIPTNSYQLWERLGIPQLVKDPHAKVGPDSQQTVQNAMLLRSDVADAWINGEITVDARRGYAIMAFRREWQYLHGQKLHLEHLQGLSDFTPLDACFEGHKRVAVLTNVVA